MQYKYPQSAANHLSGPKQSMPFSEILVLWLVASLYGEIDRAGG
jgi:hypothetical protein